MRAPLRVVVPAVAGLFSVALLSTGLPGSQRLRSNATAESQTFEITPPPSSDQRGYPRVANGRIDIGSVEVQGATSSPTPTATSTAAATATATATVTATATATATGTPCEGFTEVYHQYFDGDPPALPPGWIATNPVDPDGIFWVVSDSGNPQPPSVSGNAAFINDPGSISDKLLDSPLLGQYQPPQQLSFENNYSLQSGFDGGVLEISITGINGGAFTDIIVAGGSFVSGGYNGTISTSSGSPIAGRMAWTGSSNGFIQTTVNLPSSVGIRTFKLRWRMASDSSISDTGWRIDNVVVYGFFSTPCPPPNPSPTPSEGPHFVTISGTVSYCSNPNLDPVPGVTLGVTGTVSGGVISDGSGNYSFTLPIGGTYTVTPSKAALAPGTSGISTVDVIAVQRHFLAIGTPLSGCRLTAADVNGDNAINTVDVIAIQRFFLTQSTGLANVGRYRFNPINRSYFGISTDQTGQNYDTLIFGDVATPFVH